MPPFRNLCPRSTKYRRAANSAYMRRARQTLSIKRTQSQQLKFDKIGYNSKPTTLKHFYLFEMTISEKTSVTTFELTILFLLLHLWVSK